jgi:hypothetical protein
VDGDIKVCADDADILNSVLYVGPLPDGVREGLKTGCRV